MAYTKANILHRDVSAANILIDQAGHGVLIDWDLCRYMNDTSGAHRQWRTVSQICQIVSAFRV